jgi:hypothetical protein
MSRLSFCARVAHLLCQTNSFLYAELSSPCKIWQLCSLYQIPGALSAKKHIMLELSPVSVRVPAFL